MAALFAIQSENSSDPRFQLLILLRDKIVKHYSLELESDFVRSKDNTLADSASRGDLGRLKDEIEKLRFNTVRLINFNQRHPSDLELLLKALVHATASMKSRTKSNDFNP